MFSLARILMLTRLETRSHYYTNILRTCDNRIEVHSKLKIKIKNLNFVEVQILLVKNGEESLQEGKNQK